MLKIEKMYVYMVEVGPGDIGMIGYYNGEWWIPVRGADSTRVESLCKVAGRISEKSGKPYRLVEFVLKGEMNG